MINVAQEVRSGWCVLRVSGRADAATADELEQALCTAIEHNPQVAADFSSLEYISSCGLRALLQAARAAEARQGRFAVCSASPSVQKVFDITKLHNVLDIQAGLPC